MTINIPRPISYLALLLCAAALSAPAGAAAQVLGGIDGKVSAGAASRISGALGAQLGFSLMPQLAMTAGYTRRTRGHECDSGFWPETYRCNVRGAGYAIGARVTPLAGGYPFLPYFEASVGAFTRPEYASVSGYTAPQVGIEAGVLIPVSRSVAFSIDYGTDWMIDDEYEAMMGHRLEYTTASAGVFVRIL